MKARTILVVAMILGLVSVQAFAAAARSAIQKRPTVQITKMTLNKDVIVAVGTGVMGTIAVAPLPTALKSMTCSDIKVYVGTWTTPPPPAGGLGLSIPVFSEAASATATGSMPNCSYAVRSAPAGIQLSVLLNANQRFACNRTTLNTSPYNVQLTLTKGKMNTINYSATPVCEIIN